ncbi:hypothetical protein [Oscillochloris sp. ZM17-4]|uniref:hypothetical protein n=1 Tax=Oscillochloris sp. ZM17-4 TaxID=2866714 RepID=UPI0021084E1A|nr:hypothetical protein [Oscillochloris sp. ZM17-4]
MLLPLLLAILIVFSSSSASQAQTNTAHSITYLPLIKTQHISTPFLATFDGDPASPQAWDEPGWEVTVHSRDGETWYQLEPMEAMHGTDCGAPPATHTIRSYQDTVFSCRNHMMTAIRASGYGMIYLTPNQMADFSQGEAVIRWDMSTLRTSGRDWVDVWITPYDQNLQLALDFQVDGNGPPRNAVHIRMDFNENTFLAAIYKEFSAYHLDSPIHWITYDDVLDQDAKRRDTFELRISRTHIAFGMPSYNLWWYDTAIPDLGWDQGVVQFGHHSYNPMKDCAGPCSPNTWHWDNISISPAVPFTIIKGNQYVVNKDSEGTPVRLSSPAPSRASLRFTGMYDGIEVSFDNGTTWRPASLQQIDTSQANMYHFQSYWMPIPAGTTQVYFRNTQEAQWLVRSISVWAPPA